MAWAKISDMGPGALDDFAVGIDQRHCVSRASGAISTGNSPSSRSARAGADVGD